jgi:hypothetical protein
VSQKLIFSENVFLSGDILNIKGDHPCRKPFIRISVLRILKKKGGNFLFLLIIFLMLTAGCAAQHKYKKYKPIPCPCEKENKK